MTEETRLYLAAGGLALMVFLLGLFTGWVEDEDKRHERKRREAERDREEKS